MWRQNHVIRRLRDRRESSSETIRDTCRLVAAWYQPRVYINTHRTDRRRFGAELLLAVAGVFLWCLRWHHLALAGGSKLISLSPPSRCKQAAYQVIPLNRHVIGTVLSHTRLAGQPSKSLICGRSLYCDCICSRKQRQQGPADTPSSTCSGRRQCILSHRFCCILL